MNMRRLEADQKAMILVFRDFNFGSQIFIKVLAIFLIVPDRDLLHSTTFFMLVMIIHVKNIVHGLNSMLASEFLPISYFSLPGPSLLTNERKRYLILLISFIDYIYRN